MSGRRGLVLGVVALALAGCGVAPAPGARISGRTLTIYFGAPLHGASSSAAIAALEGARAALAAVHGRVGAYEVILRVLDDSTAAADGWDPSQTTADARVAIQDPTTIGYLGDFNSGASAISIPLLNRAGIPQVSSGSTAVGLTTDGTGAAPGEPQKYYPTGVRTFARVIPTDESQARALLAAQREAHCRSVFVLHDGEVDGEDTALTYVLSAQAADLRVVAVQAFRRGAGGYGSIAAAVASSGADCVVVSAIDERSAARLTEAVLRAVPRARIFASGELADRAYTEGLPASLEPRALVLGASTDPGHFGYEAMRLLLGAVARATDGGRRQANRRKVLAALFSARWLDSSGDPTRGHYSIYRLLGGRMSLVGEAG